MTTLRRRQPQVPGLRNKTTPAIRPEALWSEGKQLDLEHGATQQAHSAEAESREGASPAAAPPEERIANPFLYHRCHCDKEAPWLIRDGDNWIAVCEKHGKGAK